MERTGKLSLEEQLRISNSQIDQLVGENARMVEQLKDVMKMNTYWQRYDCEREKYILTLTKTNRDLQDKISDLQCQNDCLRKGTESRKDNTQEKEQLDKPLVVDLQKEAGLMKDEGDVSVMISTLIDKIVNLKDRIIELEIGSQFQKKQEVDQLQVALLQEQINVCVEDFKRERKDRERIHDDNLKLRQRLTYLESQIRLYENELSHLKKSHMSTSRLSKSGLNDEVRWYPYSTDDLTDLPKDVEIDGETY